MNSKYHIDTTPEEDNLFNDDVVEGEFKKQKAKSPRTVGTLVIVAAVHLVGIGCLLGFSPLATEKSLSTKDETVQTTPEQPQQEQTTSPKDNKPAEVAAQVQKPIQPVVAPKTLPKPIEPPNQATTQATAKIDTPKPIEPPNQATNKINTPKMTKEYVVKQGDTLNGIAKKYRLNTQRLIKLNNIQDINKVTVGQVLKFM
jgi:LysM repeat protein